MQHFEIWYTSMEGETFQLSPNKPLKTREEAIEYAKSLSVKSPGGEVEVKEIVEHVDFFGPWKAGELVE